jgi:DNA modification methylase
VPYSKRLREDLLNEGDPIFRSLEYLSNIQVVKKDSVRKVICFCGEEQERTILPHMRTDHPDVWSAWRSVFVKLRNRKWSYRKIMNAFRANGDLLFTWTVIEKELRKMEEEGEADLRIWDKAEIAEWEPKDFELERTTVWDFPERGSWAVHQSDYRGNWPPQLARNLILRYTKEGEVVVDLFVGGGTTLIEAWLTGRKSLGIDIGPFAGKMTRARLDEMVAKSTGSNKFGLDLSLAPTVCKADSRQCSKVMSDLGWQPGSVTLVCAHPPYLDALRYTHSVKGDLSRIKSVDEFCSAMRTIACEVRPWLKPGGILAVLIGDVRKQSRIVPLGFKLLQGFLSIGYELEEIVIKTQNRDRSTHLWIGDKNLPFLIAHEYLLILSNPTSEGG